MFNSIGRARQVNCSMNNMMQYEEVMTKNVLVLVQDDWIKARRMLINTQSAITRLRPRDSQWRLTWISNNQLGSSQAC